MSGMTATARRTLLLVVVAVSLGGAVAWWRQRSGAPASTEPPEWPAWPSSVEPSPVETTTIAESPATWLPANADGSVPEGHPIKAKESSGIFHEPGGRFYDRTSPDRCYATAADAEADGYRRSKS